MNLLFSLSLAGRALKKKRNLTELQSHLYTNFIIIICKFTYNLSFKRILDAGLLGILLVIFICKSLIRNVDSSNERERWLAY